MVESLILKNKDTAAKAAKFSIAICTYNRATSLDVTLQSFLPYAQWLAAHTEILVIDNNSTDDTRNITQAYIGKLPIRYIFEPKQGLAVARNRALKEFEHSAIVFFDDDISLSSTCLTTYYEHLNSDINYEFFGGKIKVDWQNKKPTWLKSDDLVLLNGLFGRYDLGLEDQPYKANMMTPFGANFALRRALIERVGLFDESLGVSAKKIDRGEETDYFERAMSLGAQGKYLAQGEVQHRFQMNRISSLYLFTYGMAKGRALCIEKQCIEKQPIDKKVKVSECVIKFIKYGFKGLVQLIKFRKDRYYQCVINMGIQYALIKQSSAEYD